MTVVSDRVENNMGDGENDALITALSPFTAMFSKSSLSGHYMVKGFWQLSLKKRTRYILDQSAYFYNLQRNVFQALTLYSIDTRFDV